MSASPEIARENGKLGGRPLGSLNKVNREKKKAEQEMVQRIVNNLNGVLNAQFSLAKGISFLYKIVETGEGKNQKREHVLVTDPEEIKDYLDETTDSEDYYYITTKAPDGKAIDSLIDRAFGTSTQNKKVQIEDIDPYAELTREQKLQRFRDNLKRLESAGEIVSADAVDLPNGDGVEVPTDGQNTQGCGTVSFPSGEGITQSDPITTEIPLEINGSNDKLDNPTTDKEPELKNTDNQ